MHKNLDVFEIRPNATNAFHGNRYRVTVGKKRRHHVFSNVFDRIHFILAGNDDIHKSLNEFEIRRDPTVDYRVGCP